LPDPLLNIDISSSHRTSRHRHTQTVTKTVTDSHRQSPRQSRRDGFEQERERHERHERQDRQDRQEHQDPRHGRHEEGISGSPEGAREGTRPDEGLDPVHLPRAHRDQDRCDDAQERHGRRSPPRSRGLRCEFSAGSFAPPPVRHGHGHHQRHPTPNVPRLPRRTQPRRTSRRWFWRCRTPLRDDVSDLSLAHSTSTLRALHIHSSRTPIPKISNLFFIHHRQRSLRVRHRPSEIRLQEMHGS
jgi:hypothetical protein